MPFNYRTLERYFKKILKADHDLIEEKLTE